MIKLLLLIRLREEIYFRVIYFFEYFKFYTLSLKYAFKPALLKNYNFYNLKTKLPLQSTCISSPPLTTLLFPKSTLTPSSPISKSDKPPTVALPQSSPPPSANSKLLNGSTEEDGS